MDTKEDRLRELLQLPRVTQIGIVVPDLEKAIAFYQEKFFVGPFERIPDFQKLGYQETYYKGEREKFNSTFAFFHLGIMEVEIIQHPKRNQLFREVYVIQRLVQNQLFQVVQEIT